MNLLEMLDKREQLFLAIILFLKLALIYAIPFTGDEAYFSTWADNLALGYYDHPPMVGWGIYLLSLISDNYYFYRFFAFITSIIVALVVYAFARELVDQKSALLVAVLFLISPISLMMSLISNDIFLLLFGALGAYAFYIAIQKDSTLYAVLAGILLGFTFLSKYFAVLLFFGLFIYVLSKRSRPAFKIFIISAAIIALFIIENLYYNYNNCWNNILFNFQSRVTGSGISISDTLLFIGTLLLLVPPYGLYSLIKLPNKHEILIRPDAIRFSLLAFLPALAIFLIVSFKNRIGLHWLLLFIPFIYILFANLGSNKVKPLLTYNFIISALCALIVLAAALFHQPILGQHKNYYQISLFTQPEEVCKQLTRGETIYSLNYSNNSMLSYSCKDNDFHVLFDVSRYGREDDKNIDISRLDSQTLKIFAMHRKELKTLQGYFDNIETEEIEIKNNQNYFLVTGSNFNYQKYRQNILTTIAKKYYDAPAWLPAGQCRFKEKYGL